MKHQVLCLLCNEVIPFARIKKKSKFCCKAHATKYTRRANKEARDQEKKINDAEERQKRAALIAKMQEAIKKKEEESKGPTRKAPKNYVAKSLAEAEALEP